jgi:iron complex outermembrane recepter protein
MNCIMKMSCDRVLKGALLGVCLAMPISIVYAQSAAPAPGNAPASSSDNSNLQEVVISTTIGTYHEGVSMMAAKLPMDTMDLPSSLSILNNSAIRDMEAVTLTDVTNYVTGATQSQNSINGFSFRGFTNTGSYTQNIEFDGLQGATLKKASLSAADVEAIEFLKGPNSILYGQMNPGGLLNIITKSPMEVAQYDIRTSVGVYAGQYSGGAPLTKDLMLDATGPVDGNDRLLYRMIVDGSTQPSSRIGDRDAGLSIYPSLTYRFSDVTYLTVKAEDSHDERRQDDGLVPIFDGSSVTVPVGGKPTKTAAYGPTAAWYTAPLNTIYENDSDWAKDYGQSFSTLFSTEFDNWTLNFQSRSVWHIDQTNEWTINNANIYYPTSRYAVPTSLLRRQFNNVRNGHRYNYGDLNLNRTFGSDRFSDTVLVGVGGGTEGFFNSRLGFGPNSTTAEAITLIDPTLDQYGYPPLGTGATADQVRQTAFGEYLSDQIKIGDLFNISLGVRHDLLRTYGLNLLQPASTIFWHHISPVTKQAGIVWHVIRAVSLYADYSESVKPQTTIAYDQYGNSNFPAEGGKQYEGGVKFENARKNVNLSLAMYEIDRTNVVVPSGTNFTVATGSAQVGQAISRLDGEQTSKGVEAEFQWQPVPNWQLQGGYAYDHAFIAKSITNPYTIGKELVNAPRNSANFWTRYNVPRGHLLGLGFGLGVVYVGTQWAGDPTTALYYLLPAWTRIDGAVYYKLNRRYDLALNIHNLLDKQYIFAAQSATTLNPGEQRMITLSFDAHFQ